MCVLRVLRHAVAARELISRCVELLKAMACQEGGAGVADSADICHVDDAAHNGDHPRFQTTQRAQSDKEFNISSRF